MATCSQSIAVMGTYSGLDEIIPNTVTPFSVTSTTNKLFRLLCPTVQTARFNFIISTLPVSTTLTFYTWNGTTAIPIGSITVTTSNSSGIVDLAAGDYIVCVRSSNGTAQSGTIVAEFTGYSQQIRLVPTANVGESMSITIADPPRPPAVCDEALYFELVDGLLPPGLRMNPFGVITGILPNLDCLPDRSNPAINWHYDENDGTVWPWGREWRFQVKVWVDGLENTAFDEEWFCIRVHNNWTFDADRFMELSEYEQITDIRVFEAPKKLPDVCVPCAEVSPLAPIFKPVPIPLTDETCEPCEARSKPSRVELIPIPVELCNCVSPETVIEWATENLEIPSDNPNIQQFKFNLSSSDAFKILMNRAAVDSRREVVYAQSFENFLQLIVVDISDDDTPPSYSDIVTDWQHQSNQAMPTMSMYPHVGESCTVTL